MTAPGFYRCVCFVCHGTGELLDISAWLVTVKKCLPCGGSGRIDVKFL